jgi:hypothetical protein
VEANRFGIKLCFMISRPIPLSFLKDKYWFSPTNVIGNFTKLKNTGVLKPDLPHYKKVCEAYVAAISLIGIIKSSGQDYWMQLVDDAEGSPDIRTGCYHKITHDNDFSVQDLEIVTYSEYSTESLLDFLLKTKFSQRKSYDDLTQILCCIEKPVVLPPLDALNKELKARILKSQSPIIIIGKTDPNSAMYKIAQIYPSVDLVIDFDLIEECKRMGPKKNLRLVLSKKGAIQLRPSNDDEKHYPFEKLGIK